MEKDIYLPEKFWNRLVLGESLEEVGHSDMGRAFNTWAYTLRQRALVQGLQSAKHYPPPAPIFEAGFGVGYYLKLWHSLGIKPVSGMDLSTPACRRVREHFPEYDLRQGDLFELDRQGDWPRLKGQFSLVTAIDVLYHVMDDARAVHVLELLAQLVAPGGIMVFTEKFPRGATPRTEIINVRRRPLGWYEAILAKAGLVFLSTLPVFLFMCRPIFYGIHPNLGRVAYPGWVILRLGTKYFARNGFWQTIFGHLLGACFYCLDRVALSMLKRTPNLEIAIFRKS